MKYQLIKHNKTSNKLVKMYDSLEEVRQAAAVQGLRFEGRSYIGGFPTFTDDKRKTWSIQGAVMFKEGNYVMCSLPQKEAESFEY